MKRIYVLTAIVVFVGITAFSLNLRNDPEKTDRKSGCTTAVAEISCDTDANVLMTAGSEKSSGCDSQAVNAVMTAGSEKSSGCDSQAVNAVMTAGSEKSSGCDSHAVNAVMTAGSEKSSGCDSHAVNAVMAAGSDKSSGCDSADKAVSKSAEKPSDCCSSATVTRTSVAAEGCSKEKSGQTTIAENQ